MNPRAILTNIPPDSVINAQLPGAYFHDCYSIDVPNSNRTALGHFLIALARTPPWVDFVMTLRNKIVKVVGMKDLGRLGDVNLSKPESAYAPGDRVSIFTLVSNTPNEVLLEVHEKYFDVVLSIFKHSPCHHGKQAISQTTVVHVSNLLGRLYMLPVTPAHKFIAKAVLSRLS